VLLQLYALYKATGDAKARGPALTVGAKFDAWSSSRA
jgi:acyl-CoA-binding protein